MLNPALYNRLRALYPEQRVRVIKPDVPAGIVRVCRPGVALWTCPPGAEAGEQYQLKCPFCGDRSGHLYISHMSFTNVVLGGEHLGKAGLIAKCFRRDCLKDPAAKELLRAAIETVDVSNLESICVEAPEEPVDCGLSHEVSLDGFRSWYPDYQPIESCTDTRVINYLTQRQVSIKMAMSVHMGYGRARSLKTGNWYLDGAPFIMLPIIEPSGLSGIQLRCLPECQPEDFPKYLFHPACKRNFMLYNSARASQFKVGVICEGAFDAIKIGAPAMALFGHTPSKVQLNRLIQMFRDGGLLWMPDNEVHRNEQGKIELDPPEIACKQCRQWASKQTFNWGQEVIMLPGKDAGELSTAKIWETVKKASLNPFIAAYVNEYIISKLKE